uniref:hypothetical protein n=1 Tax=Thaumasiovibrio occultus TaxID=1891184 RepID=UPI000B35EBF2|nr:hypothetical protein [Thaumasiovibrio occultus]
MPIELLSPDVPFAKFQLAIVTVLIGCVLMYIGMRIYMQMKQEEFKISYFLFTSVFLLVLLGGGAYSSNLNRFHSLTIEPSGDLTLHYVYPSNKTVHLTQYRAARKHDRPGCAIVIASGDERYKSVSVVKSGLCREITAALNARKPIVCHNDPINPERPERARPVYCQAATRSDER